MSGDAWVVVADTLGGTITEQFSGPSDAFVWIRDRIDLEIARIIYAGGNPLDPKPVPAQTISFTLSYEPGQPT